MNRTFAIIGGGVVGLNIALEISNRALGDVFLLEKEPYLGYHTSSRNSEVVHAGFVYSPDSLKAKLCIEGNRLTSELLGKLGVSFRDDGKWIVAYTDDEAVAVDRLLENAAACGTPDMRRAKPSEVIAAVPIVRKPKSAAFSSTTCIMDASGYLKALEVELSRRSDMFLVYPCTVDGIDPDKKIFSTTDRGDMNFDILINAAGLFADDIYRMSGGSRKFEIRPYKGEYYTWRRDGVGGLIYPVPKSFLPRTDTALASNFGIHMHRSVSGELLLGPSQLKGLTGAKEDYRIVTPPEVFIEEVSHFLDEVPKINGLTPALAGNRPKLFEDGRPRADFEIFREGDVIHLLGIESPGLTAAPAIARYIISML